MTNYEIELWHSRHLPKVINNYKKRMVETYNRYLQVKDLEDEHSKELARHYIRDIKSMQQSKECCEKQLVIVKENIKIWEEKMWCEIESSEDSESNHDDDYYDFNPDRFQCDHVWNRRGNK